jgi:hypothetical protein
MDNDYRTVAVGALADREYRAAGDAYARAGWNRLAEPREGQSPFDADERGWVGIALQRLVLSALSYRVAGADDRARARAREGVAVARDLDYALEQPEQRVCFREFGADFRAAGGLDDVEAAYDRVESAYSAAASAVDSPEAVTTTPLFQAAAKPLKQAARTVSNGEIAVTWEDLHGPDPDDGARFLAGRARFKRQRFPGLVERVVDDGRLAAPRGTTEYDNATFRCPDCSSNDVNWVADHVLCMRCSTPMAEQ